MEALPSSATKVKANLQIYFPLKRHGIVYCQGTTVIQFSHVTSANCIFVFRPIKTVLPQHTNFSKEHLIGILKSSVVHQVHLTTVWRRGQISVQSRTNFRHWTAGVFSPICTTSACIEFPQIPRQFHYIIALEVAPLSFVDQPFWNKINGFIELQ